MALLKLYYVKSQSEKSNFCTIGHINVSFSPGITALMFNLSTEALNVEITTVNAAIVLNK